ncbi:hypothetical protein [Adlercreutzia sp. CNCM I-6216]|mgnify:CR=1 FL=1
MTFKHCAEIPLSTYGFTFWWGWIFLVIFSPSGISEGFAAAGSQTVWVASMLSTAVGFALLYGLKGSVYARLWSRAVRWGVTVVMVASTVLLTWSIAMPETAGWAVLAGSTLGGLTLAYFALPWARQLSMLGAKQSQVALLLSFLGAVLLYFLLSRVPDGVRMGVVAIFPVVLGVAMGRLSAAVGEQDHSSDGRAWKHNDKQLFIRLSAVAALSSFMFCIFRELLPFQTRLEAAQSADIVFALSAGLGILLLLISLAMGEGIDFSLLFKVALPLVVLGALVFSVIDREDSVLAIASIMTGTRCASLLFWASFIALASRNGGAWRIVFCVGFMFSYFGGAAGAASGIALRELHLAGALSLTTLSIVAVLAMVLSVGWLVTVSGSPGVQDENEEKLVKSPNGHHADRLRTIAE